MKRVFASNVAFLLAMGASSLFLSASSVIVPSGTWAQTGDLTNTRAGAAAVLLSDGVVIITGGYGPDGRSASVERYSLTGGTFIPTASMHTARANHTAISLNDGRVLAIGGLGADGVAIGGAEIYDQATNAWTPAGTLVYARAGHTATLLPDGRVLVAGGENGDGALASMEVYSPVFEEFVLVAAPMTTARMRHAAALSGEHVLIMGGWDGAAALASVDVYDPATDSVSAGAAMLDARAEHTATTLLSGNVLVAGGMNAQGELQTAEVFDAVSGGFVATANAMSAARRNHIAILLPHNNSVLIAGGSSGGAASATAELYRAWQDGGIFVSTGSSLAPRNWSAGSALSFAASTTNRSGPADGLVLVAGGEGASSTELYGFATLKTDKDDYSPGMTVRVSGSGWQPNQSVTFYLRELPAEHYARLFTIDTDGSGNIDWTDLFLVEEHHLGVHFLLTAGDGVSQAHMAFTDSNPQTVSVAAPTSVTVAPGGTAVFGNVTVVVGGNTNPCTFTLSAIPALPAGAVPVFGTNPLTTTGASVITSFSVTTTTSTPTGTFTFQLKGTNSAGCQGPGPVPVPLNTVTLIVAAATVDTTTTASNAAATYGDPSVTLNATVSPASGPSVGVGTVAFTIDGATTIGSVPVTGGSASAVFPLSGVNANTYTIEAAYSGGTGFNASNNAAPFPTLVVGKAATTTVVTCGPGPFTYNGAVHTPCSANVTGAGGLNQSLTVSYPDNINAGTATASSTYAESANHFGSTDSETFTIGKAATTTVVTCGAGPFTYNGAAHTPCSANVTGAGGLNQSLTVSYSDNINAGTATASFTYAESANHFGSTDSETFAIGKAATTTVVTCVAGPFTYNGAAHTPCSASVTGAGGLNASLVVSYSNNVNPGAATANASYAESVNHLGSSDSETFTIDKAATTTLVSCPAGPFTYTGAALTLCTASVTGAGGLNASLVVSYSNNVNPGTATASASYAESVNHLGSSDSETFTIDKAATTTLVSCPAGPFTYTGTALTPCTASVTGAGGLNASLVVSYLTNVTAGTATASASYAESDNHLGSSDSENFTIDKANATIVVNGYTGNYDGAAHGATGSATGVLSEALAGLNLGATFTNVPGGTANWIFTDVTGNYNSASGTAAIVINKAPTTTTVTFEPGPYVFRSTPFTATAQVTGAGGLSLPLPVGYTGNCTFVTIPNGCTATVTYPGDANHLGSSDTKSIEILTACSAFNGFLSPIGGAVENNNTGGSFLDPVRAFKLNSTIPVKFNATCSGAPLTTGTHTLQATKVSNVTGYEAPIDATPTDAATTGNQFRLTGTEWHFNLSTKAGMSQGIWLLKATLFDGSIYTVWVEIKK